MIGGGFMGKAHALAYAAMPMFFWPAPAIPVRKVVVDVTDEQAEEGRSAATASRKSSSDWRAVVSRPDIDVVDICTPNDSHAADRHRGAPRPASTSSARSRSPARGDEAKTMLDAVKKAGVIHMVAFNYRRTPAVALAQEVHRGGPHRHDPELPRHLSAGLVGRPGLAALLALPEEDRRLRLDRRHRHPCRRPGPLSRRRDRRGQRADARPTTRRGRCSRAASTSSVRPRSPRAPSAAEVDVDDEVVTLLQVRRRRDRLAGGDPQRLWPQQLHHLRDPRHQGLDRLQLRAARRTAGDVRRRSRRRARIPHGLHRARRTPTAAASGRSRRSASATPRPRSSSATTSSRPSSTASSRRPNFEDGYRTELVADALIESGESGAWAKVRP